MKSLLLLINISLISFSQNVDFHQEISIIESDQFENILIVTEKNNLIKYPVNNYNKHLEFINIEYGDIQKIMTKNPFRIIIFYKNNQKILFLDKNLNELNVRIDLYNLCNEKIVDVANYSNLIFLLSELNQIFIYDISKGKIIRSKKIPNSLSFKSIKIFSNNNKVFLLGNSFMQVLNHQLDLIHEEERIWTKKINKVIFDNKKVYEYCYTKNQLSIMQTDDSFESQIIKNIDDTIFTIINKKIILIKNGILKQQLLK